MKKIFSHLIIISGFVSNTLSVVAQSAPVWTRDITALPDTAYLFPVRTLNDATNHIYVLSTYSKTISPGVNANKIYLRKYDEAGIVAWTLVYDNNGNGDPRGFDMAVDNGGNCYIAGGLMSVQNIRPLFLKVSAAGNVVWQRDSTTAFNNSSFDQVILKNNKLFVSSIHGIARFNLNGIEEWVTPLPAGRMTVDNLGQAIVTVYFGNPTNIVRLDTMGVINFSAVSINADRLATDNENSFYLLGSNPQYELVKFDSAGNFQWSKNNFPPAPGFGDIGFEVITDYNNDVIVAGLSGYMYKFTSSGNQVWSRQIFDLDNYLLAAKITFNNFLAVAGTANGFGGYDMKVALFDLNGNESWSGYYNSNIQQEFAVDLTIDNSGIYVIEDSISNTLLAKFESPFSANSINYNLICVSNVSYDPGNPNIINVTVFNGNVTHLNYPSVQIVSPTGDTISNVHNLFNFFAHLGNTYQTYSDTITVTGITDFSNYTFLMSDGLADTTVAIGWCGTVGINEITQTSFSIYPNPAHDLLTIHYDDISANNHYAEIYNILGVKVLDEDLSPDQINNINISRLPAGVYIIRLSGNKSPIQLKFVKQ